MQRLFGAEYLEQLAALHEGGAATATPDAQEVAS